MSKQACTPERGALRQWLQTIEPDLPDGATDSVFGDFADLTVPCLKIDLKPKEN